MLWERYLSRQPTVARDVLAFLLAGKIISEPATSTSKEPMPSVRCVQRWLRHQGYRPVVVGGIATFRERLDVIAKRDTFVRGMLSNRKKRFVYVGESYIHRHHTCSEGSGHGATWEPFPKQKPKGAGHFFIGAVVSEDPEAENKLEIASQAQLLSESIQILSPKIKDGALANNEPSSAFFVDWMERLLIALDVRGIKGAVIVMDEVSYHKVVPDGTPRSSWSLTELQNACRDMNINVGLGESRAELWSVLRAEIGKTILPVVVSMARKAGTMLFIGFSFVCADVWQGMKCCTCRQDTRTSIPSGTSGIRSKTLWASNTHWIRT
jgi:hypothetical protein